MSMRSSLETADALFTAIQSGDVDAVRDIYAPDAVIWHNTDGQSQTREQNLAVLAWVVKNIRELRYESVQRQATSAGFVQQHVLRGATAAGVQLEIPACIVCTVRDGRIKRLDEYLDTAHLKPLLAP
jgi:uncharacterized protein